MSRPTDNEVNDASGMRQISLGDLSSLAAWQHFADHIRQAAVRELPADVSIFGEGPTRYLVVNLYHSPSSSAEFYFSAEHAQHPLNALFDALGSLDYSLARLLDYLRQDDTHLVYVLASRTSVPICLSPTWTMPISVLAKQRLCSS
jgi:hypothetical protein